MVRDGEDSNSVSLGSISSLRYRSEDSSELFLEEDQRLLSMFEGALMTAELRQHGASIEISVSCIFNLLQPRLYF